MSVVVARRYQLHFAGGGQCTVIDGQGDDPAAVEAGFSGMFGARLVRVVRCWSEA